MQHPERLRHPSPPGLHHERRARRHVRAPDRGDRRTVVRPRGLHGIQVVRRREEGLPDDRVLQDVQQIGGIAPHLVVRGTGDLVAKLPPSRRAIPPGSIRIGRSEQGGDRLANRVVQHEPVVANLDEREHPKPIERVLRRRVGKHCREERRSRPTHDRRSIERLPRLRIEDAEVELGEALHDRLDRDGFQADVGSTGDCRSREPKRQRMTARDPIDAVGAVVVDPGFLEDDLGLRPRQVAEREVGEQPTQRPRPAGHGRLAPRQHDTDVACKRGQERLAEPRIQQAEQLIRIEDEDHPIAELREPVRGVLRRSQVAARPAFECGQEPPLRRLDGPAVETEHRRPVRPGRDFERMGKRRLADAGDPVDEDDERP